MKQKPPTPPKRTLPTDMEWIRLMLLAIFFVLLLNVVMSTKILEIITNNEFDFPFF